MMDKKNILWGIEIEGQGARAGSGEAQAGGCGFSEGIIVANISETLRLKDGQAIPWEKGLDMIWKTSGNNAELPKVNLLNQRKPT